MTLTNPTNQRPPPTNRLLTTYTSHSPPTSAYAYAYNSDNNPQRRASSSHPTVRDRPSVSSARAQRAGSSARMAPHDVERGSISKMKEESLAPGSSFSMREPEYGDISPPSYWDRFVDGFRRDQRSSLFTNDPLGQHEGSGRVHDGAHYYDIQSAMLETANSGLARELKGRHLQMIAIGGSIGEFTYSGYSIPPWRKLRHRLRYWAFCRIGKSFGRWRSSVDFAGFYNCGRHALLYMPSAG